MDRHPTVPDSESVLIPLSRHEVRMPHTTPLQPYARLLIQSLLPALPPIGLEIFAPRYAPPDEPHLYVVGCLPHGVVVGGYLLFPDGQDSNLPLAVKVVAAFFNQVWHEAEGTPRFMPLKLKRLYEEYLYQPRLWYPVA